MISVFIADAQRLMAESLSAALGSEHDLKVFDEHPISGLQAVEWALRLSPDVALLDLWLQGMSGPSAARLILKKSPSQNVVLMGWFHTPAEVEAVRRSGALGLLSKDVDLSEMADTIRKIHSATAASSRPPKGAAVGSPLASKSPGLSEPQGPQRQIRESDDDEVWGRLVTLTPREIEILGCLSISGRPDLVAARLSLSKGTVRLHIQHILRKTQARSHVEAVVLARQYGLI